ncbi:uncharacterized protein LOC135497106 [Lineus longissimus]|uniref:uncharacterized protein LOC135497106 n=1 Tax=Lineus longissimus TaxID=88925 RepID=UPI00315D7B41
MGGNNSKPDEESTSTARMKPELRTKRKEPWKDKLKQLRPILLESLDQLDSLLDLVEEKDVLAGDAVRCIKDEPTRDGKIRLLVEKLSRRTREDWREFKKCLEETENGHLIRDFENSYEENQAIEEPKVVRAKEHHGKSGVGTFEATAMARIPVSKSKNNVNDPRIIQSASRFPTGVSPQQLPHRRYSEAFTNADQVSIARLSQMSGSPAYSPSPPLGMDRGYESDNFDMDEKDVIGLMTKVLKKRYLWDYKTILLLPWQKYRDIPISQINRNFEMRKPNGEYCDVTLDDVLIKAAEDKKDRFILEAPAGYGKTSYLKKLAYLWANDYQSFSHFEFLFHICTDKFIEYQRDNDEKNGLSDYITSDDFFTSQSLKKCPPKTLIEYLDQHSDRVIFIIDNNYKPELPEDIDKIFQRKSMAESTVIFTCRSNHVPALYLDTVNRYTSLRITKHHPDTIPKHITEYFKWKHMEDSGKSLLRNLGIEDDGTIGDASRLGWLTVPLILVIVTLLWENMCTDPEAAHEKKTFTLDEPYIYQKVLKNIIKKYECHEKGLQSRVGATGNPEYDDEMLALGKVALQLILDERTNIPAEKLEDTKFEDDTAYFLRNVGLLEPYTRRHDLIDHKEYRFVDDIWRFFLAARYLKNNQEQGMMGEEDIASYVKKVKRLKAVSYKNIDELFTKFIAL